MKRFIWAVSLALTALVSLCHAQGPPTKAPDFKEANALYESGKFREAAAAYELVADEKKGGAAVFYNLANAQLRSGNKGKARLWYERALRIAPRDPDILWNLLVLKNALVDRIEPPPGPLELGSISRSAVARFSIDEAAEALSALLFFWVAVSFLTWKFPAFRNGGRSAQRAVFILIALTSGLFALKWTRSKDPQVVVLSKEVTARYGPTVKETKAFTLHEGTVARVTDETKDWIYVRLEDGHEGWLQKNSCETI